MKKHLFLSALVAAALAGCTSSEVLDEGVQSNAIGFTNVVNKPSRAGIEGDLTSETFDNFLVYGYYTKPEMTSPIQIFNGVSVGKVKFNGKIQWTYSDGGTRYWVPGCTYYFYAYSCGDVALADGKGTPAFSLFDGTTTSVDSRALILTQYLCDATHQHDLVYAENENITARESGNPEVSLPFSHALSKIKAQFVTDFPEGYKIYISNVYVSSFHNRGDFNVGTGVWNNYSGATTEPKIPLSVPEKGYIENKTGSKIETSDVFLIPKLYDANTNENVKLHFTIGVYKNEENVLERNIVGTWSPQWVKGTMYKYQITITGSSAGIEPIVFAAEQSLTGSNSWDQSTPLNMVFGVDNPQTDDKTGK